MDEHDEVEKAPAAQSNDHVCQHSKDCIRKRTCKSANADNCSCWFGLLLPSWTINKSPSLSPAPFWVEGVISVSTIHLKAPLIDWPQRWYEIEAHRGADALKEGMVWWGIAREGWGASRDSAKNAVTNTFALMSARKCCWCSYGRFWCHSRCLNLD